MSVTRRHFLMQLAATSGYAAAHAAMTTLGQGALPVPPYRARRTGLIR